MLLPVKQVKMMINHRLNEYNSMRRFFYNQPNILKVDETFPITDDIFHHWCKVLRANVGDEAIFFDGQGGEYGVVLTDIQKKTATIHVTYFLGFNRHLPFTVNIGLVMSRGERMDYAIQKATETGVHHIQLLTSQHGEVHLKADQIPKKLAHWQNVAISACEQCGLNRVPTILAPIPLSNWVCQEFPQQPLNLVLAVPPAHYATVFESKTAFQDIINYFQQHLIDNQPIIFNLLIGAEGGLSTDELQLALDKQFIAWQIGERVLRTETAPVVALTALLTIFSTLS